MTTWATNALVYTLAMVLAMALRFFLSLETLKILLSEELQQVVTTCTPEAMQKVSRGYHMFVSGQAYKEDMVATEADNFKLAVGMLMFPMARTEFRFDLENVRAVNPGAVVPNDSWNFMLQAHISL